MQENCLGRACFLETQHREEQADELWLPMAPQQMQTEDTDEAFGC